MSIEVLISTMNLKDDIKLIRQMKVTGKSVIINQITNEEQCDVNRTDGNNRVYSYNEKGLSRSRNRAIQNSKSDICIIADDDLTYVDDYEKIIKSAYDRYPDADIIAFGIADDNENAIKKLKIGRVGYLNSMKLCSVQLTFKNKSITDRELTFDEHFGTGSEKYIMGEENIFLFDALKKGCKIYYENQIICHLDCSESSWFKGYDERYFISKGACFYRMSHFLSNLFIWQFAIRKYKEYKNDSSIFNALKFMFHGKKKQRNKVFFVGDFISNTGPAIVNKLYKKNLVNRAMYSNAKCKILRILELLFKTCVSDAICFCNFSKLDRIGIKICKMLNKKCFYLMHGYVKYETEKIKDLKLENYILNEIDMIICVSENLREIVKRDFDNKKISYVYNGIDWDNVVCYHQEEKENLCKIMSTGGGMKVKNNIIVCDAIKKIIEKTNMKIEYTVAGNSCGQLEKFRGYDFVNYYEELSHKECLKKMAESNLYIQNSVFETFGLAPIEALANGCGLLISNEVGAKGIMHNLEEIDIIFNPFSVEEIVKKILICLSSNNNLRLLSGIDKKETSVKHRSIELLELIESEI